MKYGSLFTGIGGIDLGLDRAGMECVWQVEVNPYCTKILKQHWPDVRRYGNIFDVDADELEPVDLICGGFPCQPVSQAGQRVGTSDERWLWPEFARIIRTVKPKWVVAENVTGLLSANSGRAFAEVLRDLAQSRYDAIWDVFPAGGQGGVGAPHKRERIFIIAKNISDTDSKGLERKKRKWKAGTERTSEGHTSQRSQWTTEPSVGRVADGVSDRVDRTMTLGNAVVPQVAEKIGRMILSQTFPEELEEREE